ncbi:hypothetical protein [Hymenobacter ruricola]|uniref:DUF2335 domain-containing protein n=1 Tax=Hymenobacter ruricola TaxID=2791023 RepID=A0ABS0ICK9_9BACT|nr:hypothetical protein [Hymenobacter ruricola]MBF9224312.1 hypothetical protein [Hymenobacter ruricola]
MELTQDLAQVESVGAAPAPAQALDYFYNLAAQYMSVGKSDDDIQAHLLKEGLDETTGRTILAELRVEFKKAHLAAAKKDMLHGGLWLGGGLLVTGVTYAMASEGGSYFMTWGAIIFGGIQFFKGLVRSMQK